MAEEEKKRTGGNPPIIKSPEEFQAKVDEYFKLCEGWALTNDLGEPVFNKFGQPVIYGERPLTTVGLAYHLGFASRQSLYDYKGKAAYKKIIERAIMRIEVYTNERLFDKDGCNGAKFSLENNFKGYDSAKEAAREGASVVNIINDIPRGAPVNVGTVEKDE